MELLNQPVQISAQVKNQILFELNYREADTDGKASTIDHASSELVDHEKPGLKLWFIEK